MGRRSLSVSICAGVFHTVRLSIRSYHQCPTTAKVCGGSSPGILMGHTFSLEGLKIQRTPTVIVIQKTIFFQAILRIPKRLCPRPPSRLSKLPVRGEIIDFPDRPGVVQEEEVEGTGAGRWAAGRRRRMTVLGPLSLSSGIWACHKFTRFFLTRIQATPIKRSLTFVVNMHVIE